MGSRKRCEARQNYHCTPSPADPRCRSRRLHPHSYTRTPPPVPFTIVDFKPRRHDQNTTMTDHNRLAPPSTSSSASPTIHEEPGVTSPVDIEDTDPNIADKRLNEKTKGLPASDTQAEDDVLVVNWEGPDDPENPKKCVNLPSLICVNLLTSVGATAHLASSAAGVLGENGLRPLSSRPLHLSALFPPP